MVSCYLFLLSEMHFAHILSWFSSSCCRVSVRDTKQVDRNRHSMPGNFQQVRAATVAFKRLRTKQAQGSCSTCHAASMSVSSSQAVGRWAPHVSPRTHIVQVSLDASLLAGCSQTIKMLPIMIALVHHEPSIQLLPLL